MSHDLEDLLISLPNRNDVELHTIITKLTPASDYPTLLLLHFWGGSNRTYARLISQLQTKFNIVAPSLRGWGRSSRPDNQQAYRIEDYAEDISDLIVYLKTQRPALVGNGVLLAGHSMGGKIAQVLLLRSELKDILKGLVLIAPAPAKSFQLPTAEMREQQRNAYNSIVSARFVFENVGIAHPDAIGQAEIAALAEGAVGGSEPAKVAWPEYGMGEDYGDAVVKAVRKTWQMGQLKVLVVSGKLDQIETPSNVEIEVVERLRGAGADVTMKTLDDVGHFIPVEAPEALAGNIETFVKEKIETV